MRCDHAAHGYFEQENTVTETVVAEKSIFGDKTKEIKKTVKKWVHMMICKCGYRSQMTPYANCERRGRGHNYCYCHRIIVDGNKEYCAVEESYHTCQSTNNGLVWQMTENVSHLKHPSGLQHRKQCTICKGGGQVRINSYKPCENCMGTGGLKCATCCNLGAKPTTRSEWSFRECPSSCDNGYKERCFVCNGEQAIVSGDKIASCNKCVEDRSNVRPVKSKVKDSPSSASVRLPSVTGASPLQVTKESTGDKGVTQRPPSPSMASINEILLQE